jgi:hypothetical protein
MSNALPFIGSATTLLGTAGNPATLQQADGGTLPVTTDHNGALLVREVGGKRYADASRGNLFVASASGFTGVAPLAPGGTTAGFMFYNPSGSGILMDIHRIVAAPVAAATTVVAALGLEYGTPPSAVGTAATIVAMPLGASRGAPLGKAAFGSTIVAMAYLMTLGLTAESTAGIIEGQLVFDFDGTLVLAPNTAVNIVSTITQGTAKWLQDVIWSERLP